jgi:hypothetical protein
LRFDPDVLTDSHRRGVRRFAIIADGTMPRTPLRAAIIAILGIAMTLVVHPSRLAGSRFSRVRAESLSTRLAAGQLPAGFVLPPSDAQLLVASLIAADLDADGDLDIVATNNANGLIGIVVWVNDGTGRLTREAPRRDNNFGGESVPPSLAHHDGASTVSVPSHGPALHAARGNGWLTLSASRCLAPGSVAADSLIFDAQRSRSPPDSHLA